MTRPGDDTLRALLALAEGGRHTCRAVDGDSPADVATATLGTYAVDLAAELLRLRECHDDRTDDFDDLVRRVWEAATGDTHEGPASVDVLLSTVAALRAERDALRAIIEGRTTPPTAEEVEAHAAVGGSWLVRRPWRETVWSVERHGREVCGQWEDGVRCIALDREGRPCPWPEVLS